MPPLSLVRQSSWTAVSIGSASHAVKKARSQFVMNLAEVSLEPEILLTKPARYVECAWKHGRRLASRRRPDKSDRSIDTLVAGRSENVRAAHCARTPACESIG